MKNIFKIFILSIAGALIFSSCEEDNFDFGNGGSPGAIMYPTTDVAFLFGVTTSVSVPFNEVANAGITITGINVTKQLFTSGGDSDAVTYAVAGSEFTQTSAEMFADAQVGGAVLNENTLSPGDNWVLSYSMTLSDGRTMAIGDQTKVTFQCPSALAGSYSSTVTGTTIYGAFPPGVPFGNAAWDGTATVTVAESSPGIYDIDLPCGDFYFQYWGGSPEPSIMRDVCQVYTIDSKSDQWGYALDFTVTANTAGTVFTIVWVNGYADQGTTVITKI